MNHQFDFLIVGAGLFGSTFARTVAEQGKTSLIIDKRNHIAGNCYTKDIYGIQVHQYGPHIFHTNNEKVWSFLNRFTKFNSFINRPLANYKGKIFSLPVNLLTMYQLWGVTTPQQAKEKIEQVKIPIDNPSNLEEWALSQVGHDLYETLFRGYTKKQWGRNPKELPATIIKRLPVRFTFDNNYYNAKYQGIPVGGYTDMVQKILDHELITVKLNECLDENWTRYAKQLIYSGSPDELFNYKYGQLEYRSLKFEHEVLSIPDFQGTAIINYTDLETPYTRIVEHKHFYGVDTAKTVITKEYPQKWTKDRVAYYPVTDTKNLEKFQLYKLEAQRQSIILGGRLGQYRYWDMDQTIASAIKIANDNL